MKKNWSGIATTQRERAVRRFAEEREKEGEIQLNRLLDVIMTQNCLQRHANEKNSGKLIFISCSRSLLFTLTAGKHWMPPLHPSLRSVT